LTVLSGCLSSFVDGAVRTSKNTSGGIASPLAAFFELVGFAVVLSRQMLDSESSEMPFHFAHLCEVLD
jgi:hypothetical protein